MQQQGQYTLNDIQPAQQQGQYTLADINQPAQQLQQQAPQERPGFFTRLGQSLGIPTSQQELAAFTADAAKHPEEFLGPAGVIQKMGRGYSDTVQANAKDFRNDMQGIASDVKSGANTPGQAVQRLGLSSAEQAVKDFPIFGPTIWNYGSDIQQGNYSGAAGGATGFAAQVAGPKALETAKPIVSRGLLLGKTPEGAYESALKPSTSLSPAQRTQLAQTGLNEKIPVSQKGLENLGDLIDNVNKDISDKIQSNPNAPINKFSVSSRLNQTAQRFSNQVSPSSDLNAISNVGNDFLDTAPDPLTAEQAQRMKQGTYQALGDKAYGELQGASREAQKSLARGLKEELAVQFPELNELNARDSRLLDLQDSLERAVGRIGNHQLMGIGTPIAAGAVKAVSGSGKLGAVAGVMKAVLDNPGVKSRLAIALSSPGTPTFVQAGRIAAYTSALQGASQASRLPFLPGYSAPGAQSQDQSAK